MSNRTDLTDLVTRSQTVVGGEIGLLDQWEHAAGMTPGRAARCAQTRADIAVGEASAKAHVDQVVDDCSGLDDPAVTASPGTAERDAVSHAKESLQRRSRWVPAALSEGMFEIALKMAASNADVVAGTAEHAYASCTSK